MKNYYELKLKKLRHKNTILLLIDILLTLDAISILMPTSFFLGISIFLAIILSIFISYIANQISLLFFINKHIYFRILIGSNLIIYGFDCGVILLHTIQSL